MSTHLPSHRRSDRSLSGWQILVIGLLATLILTAFGMVLWLHLGQKSYAQAHASYLAGDCDRALPEYARAVRYPAMAGAFVKQGKTEQAECQAFIQARQGASTTDHVGSVQAWETFYVAYPQSTLAAWAVAQIGEHHLALGQIQRNAGNFEGALATYRRLATGYPTFATQAVTEQRLTYLTWSETTRTSGDFARAAAIYDEMAAQSPAFAADALTPRNEAYLAWGADCTQRGAFAQAAKVYQVLLQREHERLAPLDLPAQDWPITWLYPYGLSQHDLSALQSSFRQGPGLAYAAAPALPTQGASRFPGVVGISPDGQWLAVAITQWAAEQASQPGLPATLPDVHWQRSSPVRVVWAPVSAAPVALTDTITLPVASGLLRALAAQSEAAGQALAKLPDLYSAWGKAAQATGDHEAAIAAYIALTDLADANAIRQAAYDQLAQTHLAAAEESARQGQHAASLVHVRQAETFDTTGKLTRPLQGLHSQVLESLGDEASAAHSWQIAMTRYNDVLALEPKSYGKGLALITQKGTRLLAAADAKAAVVQTAEPGQTFTPVAQQAEPTPGWIAVMAPVAPGGLAWVAQGNVKLTLASLPTIEQADLPALQSHSALVNLARTHQTWGQALADEKQYAEADRHYRIILDDVALRSVITGTADLLAQTNAAWGDDLLAQKKTVDAVARYSSAVAAAPKSAAGNRANQALSKLTTTTTQAVSKGAGCEVVPTLDALVKSTQKAQAESALPQAIYQCGQAHLATSAFKEAKADFQRIVDSYGKSAYAAKARRGIQEADWVSLIKQSNISLATDKACEQAGATVRGRVANIAKPYVVYINNGGYGWDKEIPSTWQGGDQKTNAVACLGEVQQSLVESCPYTKGHWIYRYRYYQPIRLIDPLARVVVAQGKLYGSSPDQCPLTEWFYIYQSGLTYEGDKPDTADAVAWLKKYLTVK